MAQLGYGSRQVLDQFDADLDELIEDRYNPSAVEAWAQKLKMRLNRDIAPRLMRAEPAVEQKLRELEERYQADMKTVLDRLDRVENRVVIVKEQP